MATTLDITLSSGMQSTLTTSGGGGGVYAYAVYFDSSGSNPTWTALAEDSILKTTGGKASMTLPTTFNGGKVYFLVQSVGSDEISTDKTIKDVISTESQINYGSSETYDYRFDSFEVSLLGTSSDAGNLTSVTNFGIPMEVSIGYDDGTTDTRGYTSTGSDIFTSLKGISSTDTVVYTYSTGPLAGTSRIGASPAGLLSAAGEEADSPYKFSDWTDYLEALQSVDDIAVTGFFNGAPDADQNWHNAGFFSYEWDYDGTHYWLSPTDESEIKGHIRFDEANLQKSIYSTLGEADIFVNKTDDTAYLSGMNSGANNQWGTVLTNLFTGFSGGYYELDGKSFNSAVTDAINLNQSWNWDPSYAFARNLSGSVPADHFMDPYAYQIFLASNSYGSNYSDNLLSAYDAEGGGPLISVSEPDGGNVGSIDMTLFGDSDTPSGYIDPVLYNYIDPGADGFDAVPAAASSTHGANVVLSLSNATTAFDQANATLTIEIKTGSGDSDFQSVTLTPDSGSDIWQNWSISSDGGSFTATGSGDQPDGSVLINLPTDVGSTHWYKITFATSTGGEVGTASAITSKTFNFYAKTGSNGQFLNPTASGQEGSIAIDGLGSYSVAANSSGQSTLPSVTLDFFANRNTLPSSLLTRDTSDFAINQLAQPEAPVVGLVTSGSFVADTDHTIDGTSVAFGWAGAGDLTNPSTYSNKIGALNVALVTVKDSGGTQVGTVSGTADLDGEWSTGDLDLSSFGAGSYTATMTEFLASDTSFSTPVGRTSAEIAFTLEASNLII